MEVNVSGGDQLFYPRYSWLHVWICGSILVLLILCTIIGNVLVVAAIILERNLQMVSNYLILSLAVADLMVAVLVMPISVIYEMSRIWWMGMDLCDIWVFFDVLCCTASILHLVAIAIDRYWAVTRVNFPRTRTHSRKKIIFMIASVWILSIIISIPSRFHSHRKDVVVHEEGECRINNSEVYMVVANLGAFFLPMLVMVAIYFRIYMFAKHQIRKHSAKFRRSHSKFNHNCINGSQMSTDKKSKLLRFSSMIFRLMSFKTKNKVTQSSHFLNHDHNSQKCFIVTSELDKLEEQKPVSVIETNYTSFGSNFVDIPFVDDQDEIHVNNSEFFLFSDKSSFSSVFVLTAIEKPCEEISSKTLAPSKYRCSTSDDTREIRSNLQCCRSVDSATDFQVDSMAIFESVYSLENNETKFDNPSDVFCENCITALESELESSAFHHFSNSDLAEKLANAEEICSENALSFYQEEVIGRSISSKEEKISVRLKANAHMCVKAPDCRQSFAVNKGRLSNAMWHQLKIRSRIKIEQRRERKAARTLAIITGCFLICWLPFATQNMISLLSKSRSNHSEIQDPKYLLIDSFLLWLGYTNSCLNPIIYTVFSPDFRGAFRKILFGRYYHKKRRTC